MAQGGVAIFVRTLSAAALFAASLLSLASPAGAVSIAEVSRQVDRVLAGSLGEQEEQALFGAMADLSVQVADRYDQWVRTGGSQHRQAAASLGAALLTQLERLHGYHQGRIDRAQQRIIEEDGNPERLYEERWWQIDRGFALAAAGQLAWLHYRMAMLHPEQKEKRRGWLQKSVREFSEFIAASDERMRLESLLGRAMAERELGEHASGENDLRAVMEQGKGSPLYWPARITLAELRGAAGRTQALEETRKLLAEAQSAGLASDAMSQVRLLRLDAVLGSMAASPGNDGLTREAASLAAQISSQGPGFAQRVTQMVMARLKDPRPVLGATASTQWIAAENLAAAEKFEEAAKAYEAIARSTDAAAREHADVVHHRLGVCYFRLARYADAERALRRYLDAAPAGDLAAEAAYLQFRAAEGMFREAPGVETRNTFMAVAENFVREHPKHESRYEGLFRLGEMLQSDRRYREAADAYAGVEGPPAFRLRAASAELQCLADVLSTAETIELAEARELRVRAEAAFTRFESVAKSLGEAVSTDLHARTVLARALAAGSGPEADAEAALALLAGFEERYPEVGDLALAVTALRLASAVALSRVDDASDSAARLVALDGQEANYFDLVERLSRATLRRAADTAVEDPAVSQRWAATAATLLDRLRAAGRPIPDEVRLNLAQAYVEQERLTDAAALYAELLGEAPESRPLLRSSAMLADRRGRWADAAALWMRLARLQEVATPAWYEARLASADAAKAAGNAPEACANVREVEGFRPDLRDAATRKRFTDLAAATCPR